MIRDMEQRLALAVTIVASLVVGIIAAPHAARAATYYVATNGSGSTCSLSAPCSSIATGLGKLGGAGDTLYLRGGTYNEVIDPGSYPSGSSWSQTTPGGSVVWIGAYQGEQVTITGRSPNGVLAMWGASFVVWDHLHIHSATSHESEYVTIRVGDNPQIFQNGETSQTNTGCGAVMTASAVQVVILQHEGQVIPGGTTFRNNYMHDSPCGYGFYFQRYNEGTVIEGNDIANHGGYGIQLYGSCSTVCFHNVIIRNNVIRGNGYGMSPEAGVPVHWGGLTLGLCDGCLVYNNIFYGNFYAMDVSRRTQNSQVLNNTFYNNPADNALPTIRVESTTSNITIANNLSYQSGKSLTADEDGRPAANVTVTTNLFGVDPKFTNAGAGDFHVQESSPARQAALALRTISTDKDNKQRPAGGKWDAGAYEYGGTTRPTRPAPKNLKITSVP